MEKESRLNPDDMTHSQSVFGPLGRPPVSPPDLGEGQKQTCEVRKACLLYSSGVFSPSHVGRTVVFYDWLFPKRVVASCGRNSLLLQWKLTKKRHSTYVHCSRGISVIIRRGHDTALVPEDLIRTASQLHLLKKIHFQTYQTSRSKQAAWWLFWFALELTKIGSRTFASPQLA